MKTALKQLAIASCVYLIMGTAMVSIGGAIFWVGYLASQNFPEWEKYHLWGAIAIWFSAFFALSMRADKLIEKLKDKYAPFSEDF